MIRFDALNTYNKSNNVVLSYIPLSVVSPKLPLTKLRLLAKVHKIKINTRTPKFDIETALSTHQCDNCYPTVTVFLPVTPPKHRSGGKQQAHHDNTKYSFDTNTEDVKFPPKPPSEQLIQKVIHEFSSSQNPALIEESGCAVCGTL
ncbi:hypothetical protein GLOTRDRAFT_49258, partial [Gloeophyllum trabeum ATCC 11539]